MVTTVEDKDFFVLLRCGLWQGVRDGDTVSANPDWEYLYQLACEQTVQGIVSDGIGIYRKVHPEINISQEWNDKFLTASAQIVRANYSLNVVMKRLCGLFDDKGIDYVVLKGQGVGTCYPKPMLRCSGDIDYFFTVANYEKAKELLKPLSTTVEDKLMSLECALKIDNVDVELHGAMTSGINPQCDRHLQVILDKVLNEGDTRTVRIDGQDVVLPSANFDALYVLIHAIRHLGSFGISLRQVIDWMMLVHSCPMDRSRLQHDIKAMKLENLWRLFSAFAMELGLKGQGSKVKGQSNLEPETLNIEPAKLARLWRHIKDSGSFGHKNEYFVKRDRGRLWERYYRIYYWLQSDFKLYHYDVRFANHRLKMILSDTFKAPFRFLFGGPTKIYEGQE